MLRLILGYLKKLPKKLKRYTYRFNTSSTVGSLATPKACLNLIIMLTVTLSVIPSHENFLYRYLSVT